MIACPSAKWDDRQGANVAKRTIKRIYKANSNIYLCPECDKYHVTIEVGRYPVSESWRNLLCCLAQGMTREEMAAELGLKPRSVNWAINEMKDRFYALNRPHLVAIAISLGLIDPRVFVPTIKEKNHVEGANV